MDSTRRSLFWPVTLVPKVKRKHFYHCEGRSRGQAVVFRDEDRPRLRFKNQGTNRIQLVVSCGALDTPQMSKRFSFSDQVKWKSNRIQHLLFRLDCDIFHFSC